MNLKKITSSPKFKYLYYFVLALPVIIIILLTPRTKVNNKETETVPLISPNISKALTTDSSKQKNIFNADQLINFIWTNNTPSLPQSMEEYYISTPLVNTANILSLANKFNFLSEDNISETEPGTYLWINKSGMLFGSIDQNQIGYSFTGNIPQHQNDISYNEAIEISKKIVAEKIKSDLVKSLDESPGVVYLTKKPESVEEEPLISNPKDNNLISVSYRQKISNFPLVTRSRFGEVITITIDTTKNLFLINIYGGFQAVSQKSSTKIPDYEKLKEFAGKEAIRITYAKDLGSEKELSSAKTVDVKVKNVSVGYYQENNASIIPVFIIDGTVATKGVVEYPAKYVVSVKQKTTPAP